MTPVQGIARHQTPLGDLNAHGTGDAVTFVGRPASATSRRFQSANLLPTAVLLRLRSVTLRPLAAAFAPISQLRGINPIGRAC